MLPLSAFETSFKRVVYDGNIKMYSQIKCEDSTLTLTFTSNSSNDMDA